MTGLEISDMENSLAFTSIIVILSILAIVVMTPIVIFWSIFNWGKR